MKPGILFAICLTVTILLAGALAYVASRPAEIPIETVSLSHEHGEGPAMCPWREPAEDQKRFFPGSTESRTETLVLSSKRAEIQKV